MPLRETLETILTDYPKAKSEPLEGHALAQFIRHDAEESVQQALGELGAGKINVLLYDMLEFDNMNRVYREFFPKDPPARTTCGVQMAGGLKVEIECIALA